MIADKEVVTITNCPLCSKSHTFQLEVTRSTSAGCLSLSSLLWRFVALLDEKVPSTEPSIASTRAFTRLFTCPTTDKEFQASFRLVAEPGVLIESIQVTGPTQEPSDVATATPE